MPLGKESIRFKGQKRMNPSVPRILRGSSYFLWWIINHQASVALLVSIEPFDDVVAGYTSRTGDKKRKYQIQKTHLLPLPGIGWTT